MSDTVASRPGRLRWLRYWWPVIALVIASFPTYHAVNVWSAGRRLDTRVGALKAAGEPITVSDLQPDLIDPAANGYPLLKQAIPIVEQTTPTSDSLDALDSTFQLPLTDSERSLLSKFCDERADAVPLIESASRMPQCDVQLKLTSPLMVMQFPELSSLRAVAMYLRWQSLVHASDGRHDQAMSTIGQINCVARGGASHRSLVGFLIGTGCHAVQDSVLAGLVPDLKIGTQPGDAAPEQVRACIAALLDQSTLDRELLRALQFERGAMLDSLVAIDEGRFSILGSQGGARPERDDAASRWLRRPMIRSNAATGLELCGELFPMLSIPDAPTFRLTYAPLGTKADKLAEDRSAALAVLLFRSFNRSIYATYRAKAERNLVATALALRWYEVERGTLPDSLEALVPTYLPHVPTDPLAAGAPALRYSDKRGIVWSVGEDATDDGGEGEGIDAESPIKPADLIIHLRRQPRSVSDEDPVAP